MFKTDLMIVLLKPVPSPVLSQWLHLQLLAPEAEPAPLPHSPHSLTTKAFWFSQTISQMPRETQSVK